MDNVLGLIGFVGTVLALTCVAIVWAAYARKQARARGVLWRYQRGLRVTEDELKLVNAERIARGRSPWRPYLL